MNREVLHCMDTASGGGADMSVPERQRARMKYWPQQQHQQQQEQMGFFIGDELSVFTAQVQAQQFQSMVNDDTGFGEFVVRAMKPEPGIDDGWGEFDSGSCGVRCGSGTVVSYGFSRTASCPPAVAAAIAEVAAAADARRRESVALNKLNFTSGKESFKKRKADKNQNLELTAEDESKEKKIKGCAVEGDSKITEQNSKNSNKNSSGNDNNVKKKKETSGDASKDNSKVSEVQKPDYIHVRARRGQATDSHSLAERVRREKISERMKYLQDLVPGCNKITGKAGMLDEIINYVQSLQRQVEFLSMKLAAVNPGLDFISDNILSKELFPACIPSFPPAGESSDISNTAYLQFNPSQEAVSCSGLEMAMNPQDITLRRSVSAPISIPETFIDAPCFNQIQTPSTWDTELQNICGLEFHQDRLTSFSSQPFTGLIKQESYQDFNHTIL